MESLLFLTVGAVSVWVNRDHERSEQRRRCTRSADVASAARRLHLCHEPEVARLVPHALPLRVNRRGSVDLSGASNGLVGCWKGRDLALCDFQARGGFTMFCSRVSDSTSFSLHARPSRWGMTSFTRLYRVEGDPRLTASLQAWLEAFYPWQVACGGGWLMAHQDRLVAPADLEQSLDYFCMLLDLLKL